MVIISRSEAKEKGLTRYYTGTACKHGHVAERLTADCVCVECKLKARKTRYRKNAEREKRYAKQYYTRHKVQQNKNSRVYAKNNKIKINQLSAQFRKQRPDVVNANVAKRRAAKLSATPVWFEMEKEAIRALYEERDYLTKTTGVPHHVDHVIPLQGKKVCGLHCLANLRVVPAAENMSKGNQLID